MLIPGDENRLKILPTNQLCVGSSQRVKPRRTFNGDIIPAGLYAGFLNYHTAFWIQHQQIVANVRAAFNNNKNPPVSLLWAFYSVPHGTRNAL